MQNELGRAIIDMIARNKKTQTWLASRAGLTQASLNQLINQGNRPKHPTLRAICQAWESRQDGLHVLCGHLRDEIQAAGYRRDEIKMDVSPAAVDGIIERAIDTLSQAAHDRADIRALLLDLALIIDDLPMQYSARKVAETPAKYGDSDKSKKNKK